MAEVLPLFPRSLPVAAPSLYVEVTATGTLSGRIVAALAADGVAVYSNGARERGSGPHRGRRPRATRDGGRPEEAA